MIIYGPPTPAVAGLKLLPLIPVPLNVPPEGVPFRVTALAFTQMEEGKPVKLTVGNGFTVTVALPVISPACAVQFASVSAVTV